ncbi:MarR family winged helix-turn-helix transcriptional regulator [Microbacterium halophytorum]|uniref:MarR family winged helix-turn-helix transcriptional regulator n=1 Tax=Microbacterium halophytorum TaxID=2067568 RepID=UPI001E2DFD7C|nr:MarR family transcriptional regulator [Microbacterium halophytorum]
MDRERDLEALIVGAHALTRIAALDTRSETPSAQWRTLAILREGGPQRLGDLARISRVSQPGMTRLIKTMSEAGLVERTHDPDDSRVVRVDVTDAGVDAYFAWRKELTAALIPRFSGLSDADWAAIRRTAEIAAAITDGIGDPDAP